MKMKGLWSYDFFDRGGDYIPLSFILGFYVTQVWKRDLIVDKGKKSGRFLLFYVITWSPLLFLSSIVEIEEIYLKGEERKNIGHKKIKIISFFRWSIGGGFNSVQSLGKSYVSSIIVDVNITSVSAHCALLANLVIQQTLQFFWRESGVPNHS